MKLVSLSIMFLTMTLGTTTAQVRPSDIPRQIYGKVQVVDATTLEFRKSAQTVRLAGYEAPRLDQTATSDGVDWPAGQVSRAWMILRTLGQEVNCAPIARDANGVILAHCFVGETNLAATAIAEGIGYAFNYRGEPQVPAYFDIERKARGLGYGVWSSPDLLPPWLYTASTVNGEKAKASTSEPDTGMPLPLPVVPATSSTPNDLHGG
ncbi:thermonuclease family protein [Agrobacterium leguminum]|jgi:endonuclease YncB( thermonuclease family)|uniref:thermonuclease family protein n=1 Tax=Agrobacterium TaxID=357 RepID=UPI0015744982|nr:MULTISPECIES: thermonuclease family protein [Agrobacterium]MCZ7935876.1 thermonuclease family protein [Agrobacterium leguminum]MCZ7977228.1 thermonuclease family protein [Agrobacterium salinitolerans]NTA35575.1 nuclease [Agrobacterium salinitolerans]